LVSTIFLQLLLPPHQQDEGQPGNESRINNLTLACWEVS